MNDLWLVILYLVVAIAVLGGLITVLIRASRSGLGSWTKTEDQDAGSVPDQGLEPPGTQDETAQRPDSPAGPEAAGTAGPTTGEPELPDTAEPVEHREQPEPVAGRLQRLRARLAKSNSALGRSLLALLASDKIDESTWDEIEETLLLADIGTEPSMQLVETLRERVKIMGSRTPEEVHGMLREELIKLLGPDLDRSLATEPQGGLPAVTLVVGVNGVGKTTTVGKLARVLVAEDKDVLLGAADTFRAAAAEQLATWGSRVGVPTVKSDADGADPASVAYEAVKAGIEQEVDVVMVDTAGRLQNKVGLMDELGKVKRVIEKQAPVREALLVLDATTGQNGLNQAKVFAEVVDITGIVLTKLDGTAKGGIVVAIQNTLGVPVKLVGLGEGPDDLAPFDPEQFIDALLA
ncbi:signal recognition particle-docking protein FtsY [Acaricomes phytoseiuli]|uniref:signal recognition particle-docking protein FtsY n=1 Tax=Acaricomes phytoseiuli TaxID=291968 RepID=UPI00037C4DEF|nr:signal recognition particle-docking protein FtsY [Acaricomes phytoseiuli]MCW1249613.1 signal recognition particle-docking protein FtsY [Acaricomes phytoseiuli]